jgi:hypothetical protein
MRAQDRVKARKTELLCPYKGDDPWAAGYQRLMAAMLGEADMHGHKAQHAAVWLQAVLPVLQVKAACWIACP